MIYTLFSNLVGSFRKVLECGSPLPLFYREDSDAKRQRAVALQDAGARFDLSKVIRRLWMCSGRHGVCGRTSFFRNLVLGFVAIQCTAALFAGDWHEQSFDANWRFHRGDAPGAQNPAYNDSHWRQLDLPHDWSIEDLSSKTNTVPEIEAVTGKWRFHEGDNPAWKVRELNDSAWQQVTLPDTWEHTSNYTNNNDYGWFRRHIKIPANDQGKDVDLLLGCIDDVDEAWFNGVRIGGTGSFPPKYHSAWDVQRRYRVPASLVRGDGSDILAVRVYNGEGNGGIYAAGVKSVRIGPFDPSESENADRTGYTVGGVGWYRKHFAVNETNKLVAVRFDGVYMNAEFWINGHFLGTHPYGYTSFEFDLAPYLKPAGQENVLAVCVRNLGKNSRWYSGSGIYRHTWLTIRDPIHIPTWGVFVTTPEVSKDMAIVRISTDITNASNTGAQVVVCANILNSRGQWIKAATNELHLAPLERRSIGQDITLHSPALWSPDSPNLYSADVEVVAAGKTTDEVSTHFGVRKIEVDAQHGFRLNGKILNLRGGCVHEGNGPLGAAAIDRAEDRKVELLKANGFNAIRCAHNPPSPAFLDACDRLGMLVIDEAFDQWNEAKIGNEQDYHRYFKQWHARDIASMVCRDRNHPSVIMWSIGNEIPEQFHAEATAKLLREEVLANDPTRLITQAICNDWGSVTRHWAKLSDPAFKYLDVAGYNYLPEKYEPDHARHPDRVMMATESYPKDAFDCWAKVEKHPYVIGDFTWSAMDYLGEAGIGHAVLSNQANPFFMPWPWFDSWCGDLDICGFKKPQSFYRDVVWGRRQIAMFVHAPISPGLTEKVSAWGWPDESRCWNWPGQEGKKLQVAVYSSCDRVRLELNGKVIGEKPVSAATKLTAKFEVSYEPGELHAYGLIDGKVVAETNLKTSGPPKRLKLTADRTNIRASRNDLSYVTVEVVDANGRRVPNAAIPVHFHVSGAGQLAGQASGAPNEPASFKAPECKTFKGRCLAILQPAGGAGNITLRAKAAGIEPAAITIHCGENEN